MSRMTRFTYLLLGGCALLICLSAYMLISQARALDAAREDLRETRLELARKQAQLLVVGDALTTNQDLAAMAGDASATVARACANQQSDGPQVRALCALSQWASGSFGRFLAAYAGVAAKRVAATSPGEWGQVAADYRALQPLLSRNDDPGQQWAARIAEGVAYADYRRGDLDQARAGAERAAQLDGRSAFVGLTRLKIACAQRRPEEQVRELYSRQRAALEESIENPAAGMDSKYARLELDYFDRDNELRVMCDYAGIPAAS